ncbi:hypothetical protein KP79_PYT06620 [Mizuhopecten yessoensis]|uniref:Uncharacterized protein n=1 Tax=Mizuhopecten yessoensis TaxID=6573 RepID=A0A210Q5A8_MIZYE|nr:hypothetical protein KP79_PYT06620 [Mizuhopecten yessoensis]
MQRKPLPKHQTSVTKDHGNECTTTKKQYEFRPSKLTTSTPITQMNKRGRKDSNEDVVCNKCNKNISDKGLKCRVCKLSYCHKFTGLVQVMYTCFCKNTNKNCQWWCDSCTNVQPTIDNIVTTLQRMDLRIENRMERLERKIETLEESNKENIKTEINNLAETVVQTVKEEIVSLVDERTKELDRRRSKENNIIISNVPEGSETNTDKQKEED